MKTIIFLSIVFLAFSGSVEKDTKYDESENKDYPCYSKSIWNFDENEALAVTGRYQIKDEKEWIYLEMGAGFGLDENEKVYACLSEKAATDDDFSALECVFVDESASDFFSDMGSYSDYSFEEDWSEEGSEKWDD